MPTAITAGAERNPSRGAHRLRRVQGRPRAAARSGPQGFRGT